MNLFAQAFAEVFSEVYVGGTPTPPELLLITPGAGRIVPPQFTFSAQWQETSMITTPGTLGSPYVLDDANLADEVSAEIRLQGPVFTEPPDAAEKMVFTSSNSAVATVSATGYVTSVSSGAATIQCRRKHVTRSLPINAAVQQAATVPKLQSYLAGTLGKHITDSTAALLAVSQQTNIYTAGTTRNPNVWTGALDLTGVAYSNTTSGVAQRAGTLISPRHIMFVNHYPISVGATITYATAAGTPVTRTLTNRLFVPGAEPVTTRDVMIGKLDSDVPGTLKFYKMMPANWQDYLTLYSNSNVPVVTTDQDRNVSQRWRILYPAPASDPVLRAYYNTIAIHHTLANVASDVIVSGDSGQPLFHVIGGELVLVACEIYAGAGYLFSEMISSINAAMTTLGGGYQLTIADLVGFNNYG